MSNYSSEPETQKHIERVTHLLSIICAQLYKREQTHDTSKLKPPELEYFDKYTPLLKTLKYGTKEYQDSLDALKPALEHHYGHNRHHPEYHTKGIDSMNLIDIIEMFCDWKAASERTKDGNFERSIEFSSKRFYVYRQLRQIFHNTRRDLKL